MLHKPDAPALSRHARLFELLRQENVALSRKARTGLPEPAEQNAALAFRKMAERSFFQGYPTL